MGAYLSEPKVEKFSSDQVGKNVAYGASSMQGWRISQEDAHNCCISFDENVSLFAVYDGHGGAEVAEYCAKNLPDFIKNTVAYKNGDIELALIDAFLGFDATLAKPEVIEILKELAMKDEVGPRECSDDEENVTSLCQEAQMPLEQVMKKYSKMAPVKNSALSSKRKVYVRQSCSDKAGTSSSTSSPFLLSSYSYTWNTNETDVSSSSQHCGSMSSSSSGTKDASASKSKASISECSVSSESDNTLDSTTGNGDIAHEPDSKKEEEQSDTEVSTKNEDMPDSSGDSKHCISPSKQENAELKEELAKEENGQGIDDEVNTSAADSSKSTGDNVSSSSSSPTENGEVSKDQTIVSGKRKRIANYFDASLQHNNDDEDDDDEDEDDDENDETFQFGKPADSDEDDTEELEEEDTDSSDSFGGGEGDDDDEEYDEFEDEEDDTLYDHFRSDEPGVGSGCTAVVAILKGNDLYVANAGDSRCVLCRDGTAIELSLDHKPEDKIEMERIVLAGGRVTADGRVNGGLNLSRAIGDHSYKMNTSLPAQEQMIIALPDVRHMVIDPQKDEFMILACDGIWNFMSSQHVVEFIRERLQKKYENLSKICEELFDFCLAPNTLGDGTGCDNMTAVIVKFLHPDTNDNVKISVGNAVSKKRPIEEDNTKTARNDSDSTEEQKRQKLEEAV